MIYSEEKGILSYNLLTKQESEFVSKSERPNVTGKYNLHLPTFAVS